MSIAYFPEIYSDELLYSVLARFYLHSGYPIYTMIAEHLFPNTWKKPCIEFVGNLKQEILEIILRDITMEELINKHTMFPYYARFIPKADRLGIMLTLVEFLERMVSMKWFQENDLKDVNALRSVYKKLLIKFHPDNNREDTTVQMQEINAEYQR